MRCAELFEAGLEGFQEQLLLMKHGKLSGQQAAELASKLRAFDFYVTGARKVVTLRWAEDKKTGTLKMVLASMPGSWRSGPAAVSRWKVTELLQKHGFQTARMRTDASRRTPGVEISPDIFFWGPGTPAPEEPSAEGDAR